MAVVILIGIALVLGYILVKSALTVKLLLDEFSRSNVIVFGKQGRGKDLIFQKVINKRKKPYHANMDYGGKCSIIPISAITVDPNTFETLIDGKITVIPKVFEDRQDFYISDGGIFLPSQYDGVLDKKYKSFPVAYALSRQLWLSHIHVNTQYIGRVWKKIREQADAYFEALGIIRLPWFLVVRVRYYERYESAEKRLEPYGMTLFGGNFNRAERKTFEATNGVIKNGFFFIRKKTIAYDTRYFHRVFFGEEATKKF